MAKAEADAAQRALFRRGLPALLVLDLLVAAAGVHRFPQVWGQRGFVRFALEPVCALACYGVALVILGRRRGANWETARRVALRFGVGAGILEILDIVLENFAPALHGAAVAVGFMLVVFLLWGVAAWDAGRGTGSLPMGVATAAMAAGICMLIGVGAGFTVELFLAPPDAGIVARWAEFQRSGWTDARVFAVANTLESGFTHLVVGPVAALLLGTGGAAIARAGARPRAA
jgi:hypothetical protein